MIEEVKTVGPFKIHNECVYIDYQLLLFRRNLKNAFLSVTQRGKIPLKDQAIFDDILLELRQDGVHVEYVDDINTLFDRSKAFDKLLSATTVEENKTIGNALGLDFSDEELTWAITYREQLKTYNDKSTAIKEKLKNSLTAPHLPYEKKSALDLDKIFGRNADEAKRWIDDSNIAASYELRRQLMPTRNNLLRIAPNGRRIESLSGYALSINQAKIACEKSIEMWKQNRTAMSCENIRTGDGRHRLSVFNEYIAIGCQEMPRAEVERLAVLIDEQIVKANAVTEVV